MSSRWPLSLFRSGAARWFVRLRASPITPRLDTRFRRWLAADPSNEVDYERHELAWELAAELANDAEIKVLLAEAQSEVATRKAPRTRRLMLSWAAAAATLVAVVIGIGIYVQGPLFADVYITAVGEQRTVVLPDRSRMSLNTATRARVSFKRNVRIIELDYGEATFSVTPNAKRPFEVYAAHGRARALGTEFNVMSSSRGATVAVLSGKVEVTGPESLQAAPALLVRSQEVSYDAAHISAVQSANANRILAWHSGRIAFEDVDLEHAIAEFNRYTGTPIVLGDESLGTLRVTGVFRIGETDALLQSLNIAFGIRANKETHSIRLVSGS
jgi:transmembrane sensor